MSTVQFISERDGQPVHEYWDKKIQLPSVSAIIKPLVDYAGIKKEVMENARQFGSDVDAACQFYDEDDLDPETLDQRVSKRLGGWIKFRKEFKFEPEVIAKPEAHSMSGMWYGMTADRFGTGNFGAFSHAVVDIKNTAEIEKHHCVQLAAYHDFYSQGGKRPVARIVVQLLDEDYKIHEFKDRQDRQIFLCLLAVTHWKWQKGIK